MTAQVKAYLDFLESAKDLPCYDAQHEGNGPKYHTGKSCAKRGCDNPAGTWWSPVWCFDHNVERLRRVDGSRAVQ